MKKLFILGASVLQLPAILTAKKMGLHVAVADYNSQAVGIPYADVYYNVSTMDEEAICKVAKQYQPDGIMTLATDMPIRGVAMASEMLGLHSISYETAIKATDKYSMIKAFKEHGVPSPWYYVISSIDELQKLSEQLTFPCIIKPTDNAGSHGVVLVHGLADLVDSYNYSRKYSRGGNIIIEEFLQGKEVSVEVMVIEGNVHILQITDKLTTGAPYFVEMGHSQPAQLSEKIQIEVCKVTVGAVQAIGIDNGPAHVEMMITVDGPIMIELGARMGGDNITTCLLPLSTGVDMVKATINVALGEKPDIKPRLHCGSAVRYIEAPLGVIRSISGVEEARAIAGVEQIIFTTSVGEKTFPVCCSNDRVGFVIAQAENVDRAVEICEKAIRMIKIDID